MEKFFEEGQIPSSKVVRLSAVNTPGYGSVGCSISHLKAILLAKNNAWKNVLILEDDCKWNNFQDGYSRLEKLCNDDFDVCMLGHRPTLKSGNRILLSVAAYAYLVNDHYYDTLINTYREAITIKFCIPRNIPFNVDKHRKLIHSNIYGNNDVRWGKNQLTDTWIGIFPALCKQAVTISDNTGYAYDEEVQSGTPSFTEFSSWIDNGNYMLSHQLYEVYRIKCNYPADVLSLSNQIN
jgi:hypothetical protein